MEMKPERSTDTIAAIATATGLGGIGIVRLSGSEALTILQRLFSRKARVTGKDRQPFRFEPRRLEHGWVLNGEGAALDEVLVVYMPGPHTFSGEDTVEIHCHGGRAVLDAVLAATLDLGARLAGPGEFTRRAFLNGRLDLSQAEAVAEMIAAPTLPGVFLARNKLEGRLGRELQRMRAELDQLRSRLFLVLDFPEDAETQPGAPDPAGDDFQWRLEGMVETLRGLLSAYARARVWREGALAALAGQVNVGKSSLLNALLGRRRALVSDQPGTTRDFIEETLNLRGLPVRLVDTAGLREAGGSVEAEGIDMAREIFCQAEAVLLVLDGPRVLSALAAGPKRGDGLELLARSSVLGKEDLQLIHQYGADSGLDKLLVVLNKMDLCPAAPVPESLFGSPCCAVSARTGSGLERLAERLRELVTDKGKGLDFSHQAAPNARQAGKLGAVLEELDRLKLEYADKIPADLLSARLDSAAEFLADVMGLSGTEEILDQVFANFCIGK